MKQRNHFNLYLAQTAGMLSGARRVALLLLLTLLTTATAWADDVTLQTDGDIAEGTAGHYYVNMPENPATGTNTLTISSEDITNGKGVFKVYDDGGKNGLYGTSDYSLIINVPEGYILQMKGDISLYYSDQYVRIYNGTSADNSARIANYCPQECSWTYRFRDISLISSGNNVLLDFHSNEDGSAVGYDGINLTVSVVKPNDLALATITGINSTYYSYGAIPVPTVTDVTETAVAATEYDVVCTYNGETVTTIDKAGAYTLTVKAKEGGNYVGSNSVEFFVCVLTNGDGTAETPYQLSSVNDIRSLALLVNENLTTNAHAKLMADIDFSNETKDNVTGNNYLPIGTSEHPYTWLFDGNNHLISGISNENKHAIFNNGGDAKGSYQGVFGYVGTGGTVKDLTLGSTAITGKKYAGGIVGYNKGTINNCHVLPSVTITGKVHYSLYHGGIAGLNTGTVSGCTSAASVVAGESFDCYYYGGIVGKNSDGTNDGTLSDNLYYGSHITYTLNGSSGGDKYRLCGTILGEKAGTLSNNYYTSDIKVFDISNVTKGCGINTGTDPTYDNPYDIPENNGAMPIYKATPLVSGLTVTTTDGGSVCYTLYDGTKLTYYKSGVTLTVSNSSGKLYDLTMPQEDISINETGITFPWGENTGGYCGYTDYVNNGTADLHNLYYQITDEDGDNVKETLTIYVTPGLPEGANKRMAFYQLSKGLTPPWYHDYASQIKHLVISEGVTATGQDFLGNGNFPNNVLTTITLPSTIFLGTQDGNDSFEIVPSAALTGLNSLEKIIVPVSVYAKHIDTFFLSKSILQNDGALYVTPEIDVTNGSYHLEGNYFKENDEWFFKVSLVVKANSGYALESKTVKIGSDEVAFDMTPNDDGSIYTGSFNLAVSLDAPPAGEVTVAATFRCIELSMDEIEELEELALDEKMQDVVKDGRLKMTVTPKNKYWTLACGVDLLLPKGVVVYKARMNSTGTKVELTEIDATTLGGVLKANNGVVIASTPGESYDLVVSPNNSVTTLSNVDSKSYGNDNELEPVLEETHFTSEDYFILMENKFVMVDISKDTKVPAGKAVLKVPAGSVKSRSMDIDGDETTGIHAGMMNADEEIWYNLQGQRINKPTRKGVYILNGKKVRK
jgi:hypothetical protein